MNFYNLSLLLLRIASGIDVICSNAAASCYTPPAQGSALWIILSTCCTRSALLWISGCHVCVLTGFHPYGTTQIWTKLNTTGCQEQGRVRQQGEHVKRPDGFLFGDGDWVRQLVLVGEVSKCEMRLFCIMAAVVKVAESCRDRLVTGRSVVWDEMPAEKNDKALLFHKVYCHWALEQGTLPDWSCSVAQRLWWTGHW